MQKYGLSVVEAAERAGVCRRLIYQAIGSGALPAVKCGRRTIILAPALDAWLASQTPYPGSSR